MAPSKLRVIAPLEDPTMNEGFDRLKLAGKKHHEITSEHIKHLAGKGLQNPTTLTEVEVKELCGSVLAHIERREAAIRRIDPLLKM
jgi:hypothetical protein